MTTQISSPQNHFIKQLIRLRDKVRERRKTGLFLVEGQREISLATKGGYHIKRMLYEPNLYPLQAVQAHLQKNVEVIEISQEVYNKLAVRNSTEGIIALVEAKNHSISNLSIPSKSPLILVADSPEKPGNIGALLRTADAANIDAVIIANPRTDLYNPNIIRASVGCVFTAPIAMGATQEVISFLQSLPCNIYTAISQHSEAYFKQNFTRASAIVMGTEHAGLPQTWLNATTKNINIPMQGNIDSLNVSVAAGILIFEAIRQRQSN